MQYTTDQLIAKIQAQAIASGIDPAIAVEQARVESGNFNPTYVYGPGASPKGAQGLFQFMPATAARFGLTNPFNPDQAILAWSKYMIFLLHMFNGRYDLALAGYNWGENRAILQTALQSGEPLLGYGIGAIPQETFLYVNNILDAAGYDSVSVGLVPYGDSAPIAPTDVQPIIYGGDLGTINVTAPPLDDTGDNTKMILAFVGLLVGGVILASIS